jgi:hypothetical protein
VGNQDLTPCHVKNLNCESPILRLLALLSKGHKRVVAKNDDDRFHEVRELPIHVEVATSIPLQKYF